MAKSIFMLVLPSFLPSIAFCVLHAFKKKFIEYANKFRIFFCSKTASLGPCEEKIVLHRHSQEKGGSKV